MQAMNSKNFDPTLSTANDDAKFQVIDWLRAKGFDAQVNPDQYGVDVICSKGGIEYQVEVEVKHNWTSDEFPFPSVHVGGRKKKFVEDPENVFLFMLNHRRTQLLIIKGIDMREAPLVTNDTKYTADEKFIEIPIDKCVYRDITGR